MPLSYLACLQSLTLFCHLFNPVLKPDLLHPSQEGLRLLSTNIELTLLSCKILHTNWLFKKNTPAKSPAISKIPVLITYRNYSKQNYCEVTVKFYIYISSQHISISEENFISDPECGTLLNMTFVINNLNLGNNIDCMFLTETWFSTDGPATLIEASPPNYNFTYSCRQDKKQQPSSQHHLCLRTLLWWVQILQYHAFVFSSPPILCVTLYRPPKQIHFRFFRTFFTHQQSIRLRIFKLS